MNSSQHTETTVSSPAERLRSNPSVWLDVLPFDICVRIASFLPRHPLNDERNIQYLPDVLSLAAVSEFQQLAIASAQSHTISIEKSNSIAHTTTLIRYWRHIVGQVRQVHLPIDTADNEDVGNLLSLPTITKASLPNYPCLLRALHTGRSVRQLELRLTIYCPENGEKGLSTGVSILLRDCPIEQLRLVCQGCNTCPSRSCFAARLLKPLNTGRKCDTLKLLHLKCTSVKLGPLTKLPSFFPNLEEFHLEHWATFDRIFQANPLKLNMSDKVYEDLRTVKRLGLIRCGSIGTFAPRLGSNLESLSSDVVVSSRELMTLETCPNLRSLDIVLAEGAEVCFPLNLCNLRSISLTWNSDHPNSLSTTYYAPDSGVLSGLIWRNNQVEELSLKNIRITSFSLHEMLSTIGDSLRVLQIPIFHQGESPASRFSRLARLIVMYNTNLSDLEVCSASFGRVSKLYSLVEHECGICNPNLCSFCELLRCIDLVLRVLKRRNLRFRDDGIRRLQFHLEPWR